MKRASRWTQLSLVSWHCLACGRLCGASDLRCEHEDAHDTEPRRLSWGQVEALERINAVVRRRPRSVALQREWGGAAASRRSSARLPF